MCRLVFLFFSQELNVFSIKAWKVTSSGRCACALDLETETFGGHRETRRLEERGDQKNAKIDKMGVSKISSNRFKSIPGYRMLEECFKQSL